MKTGHQNFSNYNNSNTYGFRAIEIKNGMETIEFLYSIKMKLQDDSEQF